MNTWGHNIRISLFGESRGVSVGCVIDGLPAGIKLNHDAIRHELSRRAPNNSRIGSTTRTEPDNYEIISGVRKGYTSGSPLCVLFKNTDLDDTGTDNPPFPRPSHADYAANIKHAGFCDLRGGGHFSARLTVSLVFLGAICRCELARYGVRVQSHIQSIGKVQDDPFDPINTASNISKGVDSYFPLLNASKRHEMEEALECAKADGDTLGGVVECAVINLPIGLGEPFFNSVESVLSHMLFSIPAVKAVEFGAGFKLSAMTGSKANDQFDRINKNDTNEAHNYVKTTQTNSAGGITGGLTNGMPVIFRVGFKPIPSIRVQQQSFEFSTGEPVIVTTEGKHDVCAALRGAAIVESAACICFFDFGFSFFKKQHLLYGDK